MKNLTSIFVKTLILMLILLLSLSYFSVSAKKEDQQVELDIKRVSFSQRMAVNAESITLQFPGKYHNLSEVYAELDYFNQTAPDLIDYSFIGMSYWNNPIPLITLTNEQIPDQTKGKTYVVAHHHAREQITIEHAIRTIRDLVNGYIISDKSIEDLIDRTVMYFIVTANPDSLDYTLYQNPWQRKNMRPIDDDGDGLIDEDGPDDADGDGYVSIYSAEYATGGYELWTEGSDGDGDGLIDEDSGGGVDLNRNFPYKFKWSGCDSGTTMDTNSETYAGATAASENETKALIDFVSQHKFTHALSLHSGTTIPIFPWGWTNDIDIPEKTLYEDMLNYWQSEQLLPENYFDETNTDVDYTVAGGWTDWCYASQHTMPLLLEIYKPLDSGDWHFFQNNGTHNIYESHRVFFDPPENQIETLHRELYNFEEHWLGLTPSIEVEKILYVKSDNGNHKAVIYLKSGSQYFNTTDTAQVLVYASNNSLITDYPESIGPFFPTKTVELSVALLDDIPDEFTLYLNVTSDYASDLSLAVTVSISDFKSTPGFDIIFSLSSVLILLLIIRKRKQ